MHALAVEGNFDDCQNLVKAMFNDAAFRDKREALGRQLDQLGAHHGPDRLLFHDSDRTRRTGPEDLVHGTDREFRRYLRRLLSPSAWACRSTSSVIATNENDILARTLKTGRYEMKAVKATTSPSMDIQISSNFERLLFEAYDRDASKVRAAMDSLKQSNGFEISPEALTFIKKDFRAGRASERRLAQTIRKTYAETGYLLDPHFGDRRLRCRQARKAEHADGDACHRPSGEIPGRRKIRLRY